MDVESAAELVGANVQREGAGMVLFARDPMAGITRRFILGRLSHPIKIIWQSLIRSPWKVFVCSPANGADCGSDGGQRQQPRFQTDRLREGIIVHPHTAIYPQKSPTDCTLSSLDGIPKAAPWRENPVSPESLHRRRYHLLHLPYHQQPLHRIQFFISAIRSLRDCRRVSLTWVYPNSMLFLYLPPPIAGKNQTHYLHSRPVGIIRNQE